MLEPVSIFLSSPPPTPPNFWTVCYPPYLTLSPLSPPAPPYQLSPQRKQRESWDAFSKSPSPALLAHRLGHSFTGWRSTHPHVPSASSLRDGRPACRDPLHFGLEYGRRCGLCEFIRVGSVFSTVSRLVFRPSFFFFFFFSLFVFSRLSPCFRESARGGGAF